MPEKVIIIGSGPAGWAAAIYAARASLEPLVIQGSQPLGQLNTTTEVENYPGFPAGNLETYLDNSIDEKQRKYMMPHSKEGVSGPELMELMRQQAGNFGTRIVTDDVSEIELGGHPFVLKTAFGETYEALTVIVATGASANYLGLPSEEKFKNKGVSACAVCDGALPRFLNKPLAVIGGGDSAVEEADYLTKTASKVYLVHRRDELRASKIMAQRAIDNPKMEILWNRTLSEVLGDDTDPMIGVTGMRLASTVGEDDLELAVSGVFLGIGHTPNTAFLGGQLDLTEKGYLARPVPFRSNTNIEGVFSAGDVADDYYRQAITAAGSGCMAALDAERWLTAKGM